MITLIALWVCVFLGTVTTLMALDNTFRRTRKQLVTAAVFNWVCAAFNLYVYLR